uniref:Uncharacterized protein LOC113794339 isoform X3 n=1 Tax=Dermatophagoides pteronyssinus TaxID=6956 RepID=A0A6P6Y6V8_DERPT|nr:uncharacterized protein LOC113794339 isoform X3 [Dermatophagoides pteronyssinus]
MTITFVWAAKYPIIVDNEKSMHRFPYKPIYGLPDNLNCTNDLRKKFNECEDDASETWSITIDEYFYETRKFCCFAWSQLTCEISVAKECEKEYAELLLQQTIDSFDKICSSKNYGSKSIPCSITPKIQQILIIVGVIVGIITFLCLIAGLAYKCNQASKIGKLKTQAYKLAEENKKREIQAILDSYKGRGAKLNKQGQPSNIGSSFLTKKNDSKKLLVTSGSIRNIPQSSQDQTDIIITSTSNQPELENITKPDSSSLTDGILIENANKKVAPPKPPRKSKMLVSPTAEPDISSSTQGSHLENANKKVAPPKPPRKSKMLVSPTKPDISSSTQENLENSNKRLAQRPIPKKLKYQNLGELWASFALKDDQTNVNKAGQERILIPVDQMSDESKRRETEAIFESYRGRPFRQYQTRTNKSITTNQSAINKKGLGGITSDISSSSQGNLENANKRLAQRPIPKKLKYQNLGELWASFALKDGQTNVNNQSISPIPTPTPTPSSSLPITTTTDKLTSNISQELLNVSMDKLI